MQQEKLPLCLSTSWQGWNSSHNSITRICHWRKPKWQNCKGGKQKVKLTPHTHTQTPKKNNHSVFCINTCFWTSYIPILFFVCLVHAVCKSEAVDCSLQGIHGEASSLYNLCRFPYKRCKIWFLNDESRAGSVKAERDLGSQGSALSEIKPG